MSLLRSLQAWFGGGSAARPDAAIRLHESGDLAGAEQRYRAILHIPRLAGLRRDLRWRYADSPLMDYTGFTRALEAAYRDMWRTWIKTDQGQT